MNCSLHQNSTSESLRIHNHSHSTNTQTVSTREVQNYDCNTKVATKFKRWSSESLRRVLGRDHSRSKVKSGRCGHSCSTKLHDNDLLMYGASYTHGKSTWKWGSEFSARLITNTWPGGGMYIHYIIQRCIGGLLTILCQIERSGERSTASRNVD